MNLSSAGGILLAFGLYAVLHSLLAGAGVKDWATRRLGAAVVQRCYRLFFNVVGLVSLLPVLVLVAWLPDGLLYRLPVWALPFSLLGQLAGLGLLAASLRQTGIADFLGFSQLAGPAAPGGLVTGGVYARVRHPLYTGSLLVLWLLPWMSSNTLALIVAITLYFVVGSWFEERKLEKAFGRAYQAYKERTPAFIPRLTAPRNS
ncbi:MAG: isoprenylcysteine carboxylmethyltransferase family protein [Anaerolineales bacterium]|nr:isoprenylcysteine carboxylmethyltransferase family protein [Anaerolineales bacterium]